MRIDANGARHLDSGNGGGSRSGSGELATLGAGLQPLRLLPGRRAAGQAYADGEPHSGVASPVVAQQVVAEQQQYHPQLKEGMLSAAQRHHHHAQFGQGAQQLVGVDEEAGVAGSGQGNGTLLTPTSPTTLRRNGRLALLSMLLLVFQGTALSIMLRYSRAREGQPYLASVSGEARAARQVASGLRGCPMASLLTARGSTRAPPSSPCCSDLHRGHQAAHLPDDAVQSGQR